MTRVQVIGDLADGVLAAIQAQADAGEAASQVMIGQVLLDGVCLPRNPAQAFACFSRAAASGDPMGLNMRGRCLERGWGVAVDLPEAAACYRAAARQGLGWARYNLANMLLRGRGIAHDRKQAWALFLDAAFQGHAKSMNLIGRFLDEGWDRRRNPDAAMQWYRRAALAGDYRGQHNLASMLAEHGRAAEAVDWWRRALEQATADVLQAMEQALRALPGDDAQALWRQVGGQLAGLAAEECVPPTMERCMQP